MYFFVGVTFIFDKTIYGNLSDDSLSEKDKRIYLKLFYIARLTNNLKIFIPLMTFILRINDPFIKKILLRFFY